MFYLVLHMDKFKKEAIRGIQSHNRRERESHSNPDIDYGRSAANYELHESASANYAEDIQERIDDLLLVKTVRKDAVRMCGLIVTSDSAFFQKLSPEDTRRFFEESKAFLTGFVGAENVISAMVHMDEKTPHMHFLHVPVTPDGRLNANTIYTRQSLRKLQSELPAHLQRRGFPIERGVEQTPGSAKKHLDTREFKQQREALARLILESEELARNSRQTISALEQREKELKKSIEEYERQAGEAEKVLRENSFLPKASIFNYQSVLEKASLIIDGLKKALAAKEAAFLELILRAYRAEKVEGFTTFHGKRAGRMVVVGPVNLPVTRLFVEEIILECRKHHVTKVDILGFEFEMGLFPNVLDEARGKGIDIAPKYIPAEVFDKRAVEKNQVVFHDVSFIEVKPHYHKNSIAVELTDFSVFYSQDSVAGAEATLKDKSSKIVVEKGQIVKVSKDKNGIVTREQLTRHWTDWIDYWSVDFDFESKREIIRVKNPDTGEVEEQWTGDFIFENEWQSFRTKKDRKLELKSVFHELPGDRRKVAVKVVDIFGNDTMTIVEVAL